MTPQATDLEWGEVLPRHWQVRRLKHLCEVFPSNVDKKSYEGDPSVLLCNYTDVYYNDTITGDLPFMEATATPAQIDRFSLRAGDTIVTKDSETPDDIAIAAFVPEDLPGVICGYHLAMLRPRNAVSGGLIKWWFGSHTLKASVHVRANGLTRVGLGQYDLDNLSVPVPPFEEQGAIATFLNRETGKIDALVEEQRRLIELLKEKRQAVLSHAVTKGLDPNARMKPSGVEWLGDVPAHWEVRRLATLFAEVTEPGNDDLPIFSVSIHHGVSDTELDEDELDRKVTRSDDRSKYKRVERGDLVYNMMWAWQGAFGAVQAVGMVSPAYVVARPKVAFMTEFVEAMLRTPTAVEEMRRRSRGVTDFRLRLYWEEFKDLVIALPPPQEQRTIMAFVAAEDARLRGLSDESSRLVELLKERRAALISAAVTGKIDVRDAASADAEAA